MVKLKENDIVMGRTYRDVITGFTGIATGYLTYITGCDNVLIRPPVKDDGTLPEGEWIDIERLEPVENVADVHLRRQPAPTYAPLENPETVAATVFSGGEKPPSPNRAQG